VAGETLALFAISTIPDIICKGYAKNCKYQDHLRMEIQ